MHIGHLEILHGQFGAFGGIFGQGGQNVPILQQLFVFFPLPGSQFFEPLLVSHFFHRLNLCLNAGHFRL